MSATQSLFEFHANVGSSNDALFLERLESFMEKSLSDIRAFAERESKPYEEARRYVAEWHAKNLFSPSSSFSESTQSWMSHARLSGIQNVLRDASKILELLSTSSGVQSFLLAVDPYNPSDGGFLGGSVVGREFWRGLRGGGETGARSFKTHCTSQLRSKEERVDVTLTIPSQLSVPPVPKTSQAKSLKNELYESVRTALRSASGVRTAEMKWTNPERLDVYGVRLVGWPEGVPSQNPSSLKASQNRVLLDALQNGKLRFEGLSHPLSGVDSGETKEAEAGGSGSNETAEDFSWAYDADAGPLSPVVQEPTLAATTTISACSSMTFIANDTPSSSLDDVGENDQEEEWNLEDHIIGNGGQYSTEYTWGDELHVDEWGSVDESERPRKRLRSEEPA